MEILIVIALMILSFIVGYIVGKKKAIKPSEDEIEFRKAFAKFLNYDGSISNGNSENS